MDKYKISAALPYIYSDTDDFFPQNSLQRRENDSYSAEVRILGLILIDKRLA